MKLGSYYSAGTTLVLELRAGLTNEDVASLRKTCGDLGIKEWDAWCAQHQEDVVAFLAASPSQRRRKKSWADPELFRRLSLAAAQHVLCAKALMTVLMRHSLEPGCSNREMAVRAGQVYWDVLYEDPSDWPFGEPDPFQD